MWDTMDADDLLLDLLLFPYDGLCLWLYITSAIVLSLIIYHFMSYYDTSKLADEHDTSVSTQTWGVNIHATCL